MKYEPIKVTFTEDERRPFLFLLRKHGGPGLHCLFEIANGNPVTRDQLMECANELYELEDRIAAMEPDLVTGDDVCVHDCRRDLSTAVGQVNTLTNLTTQFATLTERAVTTRGEHG